MADGDGFLVVAPQRADALVEQHLTPVRIHRGGQVPVRRQVPAECVECERHSSPRTTAPRAAARSRAWTIVGPHGLSSSSPSPRHPPKST